MNEGGQGRGRQTGKPGICYDYFSGSTRFVLRNSTNLYYLSFQTKASVEGVTSASTVMATIRL